MFNSFGLSKTVPLYGFFCLVWFQLYYWMYSLLIRPLDSFPKLLVQIPLRKSTKPPHHPSMNAVLLGAVTPERTSWLMMAPKAKALKYEMTNNHPNSWRLWRAHIIWPSLILWLILSVLQFTDVDGGVTSKFVLKLQLLDAKNSEQELSIEKYLVKSEEAFFGKVRKDKLSIAASLRSSQRNSIWGTPTSSLYSRPDCGSFYC